jgi:hypothetical protein
MTIHTAFGAVALVALCTASPLLAQSDRAHLELVVVDVTDGRLPDATAIVTMDGMEPVVLAADELGRVSFDALPDGPVDVRIESPYFDPYVGTFTLAPGENEHTVTLQLGAYEEQVIVTPSLYRVDGRRLARFEDGRHPRFEGRRQARFERMRSRLD